ncbi:RNA polymerase sigma factor [Streptomyces sp. NPDC090135]|uniref:RNA polymerase sigma factor n=1 Tax=Streptomyces sp. NPDC090135 TaxID=3365957 RepID=UPI0037F1E5F0
MSETGRADLTKLGPGGYGVLMEKVIASLTGFEQLNAAERKDVATEAIFKAVSRKQFDPSKEPAAYIKTIARNMALKKVENLKGGQSVLMDNTDLNALTCTAVDAGEAEQEQDLVDKVNQALRRITSAQQREVTRRRAQDEKADDIASSLGISTQQVHTQYSRGRTKVRTSPEVSPYVRAAYVQSSGHEPRAKGSE